ncbi:GNAT family N-acetyltransferase, partial [Propionibacterium freudenreichii]|nr:GNAT family N-acetyltransferase [Propionibacterium freudenreichii]
MVDLDLPRAHRWPLTLRFGPLALRPIERRDAAELRQLRARNREWTGPWDTT